ncbi:MAG: T9SS type A sorting domain-containing protein [Saprospiraceae bacterium]|nr:T9SS type A sorting domain-containing protein [Saprospiraceae bacterium]
MKKSLLFTLIICATIGYSQSLPFDFEPVPLQSDFIDFDGGTASVIPNPFVMGVNTSPRVGQIIRNGGTIWAGSKVILSDFLDFSTEGAFSMKVFSPVEGITMKLKLEGNADTERDATVTVANEWETLTWDFTGEPSNTYNTIVFMFDFGNTGDGSSLSTFLFDDVDQLDLTGGLDQVDLPVTFEETTVFYQLTDFGGTTSMLGSDPVDGNNTVAISTKPDDATTWAGTTMSTAVGFKNQIPITASDTKMTVRVYSPDAGIPVRLKIEDHTDPTKSVETEALTTQANTWEYLLFDFNNEAPGTAILNPNYTFDLASIFFNFGTDGVTAGEKTYYWDDVYFGEFTNTKELEKLELTYFPNPVIDRLQIKAESMIEEVTIINAVGQQVLVSKTNSNDVTLDLSRIPSGIYLVNVKIGNSIGTFEILKSMF